MVHKTIFLNVFATLFIMAIISTSSFAATPPAAKKPKLVLMPIKISEEDRSLAGAMETALVEGLQERYIVFSGERVQQKTREIFTKESKTAKAECDETKCMEDIAIAFQAELIAVANVTKRPDGYFLAISIQNIFDNKVVYSKSLPCKGSDDFEIIEKLKELAGTQLIVNSSPASTKETKLTKTNNSDIESALWTEVQSGNTEDEYKVYIDTYPKGKYVPLAKLRIKKLQDVISSVEQQSWDIAQQGNTEESYNLYLDKHPKGRFLKLATAQINKIAKEKKEESEKDLKRVWRDPDGGLMWQDNQDTKTITREWQGAVDYCSALTHAGYSDWQLPDIEMLKKLYLKKHLLHNIAEDMYWSNSSDTRSMNKDSNPMSIDFKSGYVGSRIKIGSNYVRCVRVN